MIIKSAKVRAKREKQKDKILEIAARLFEEHGFEKISLHDVAKHFGKGRTTIYEYFENKNELLAACLEREMTVYREKVISIMEGKGTFRDKLNGFIRLQLVYGATHLGYSRLFRTLAAGSKALGAKTQSAIVKLHQDVYTILIRQINTAVEKGEIRDAPPGLFMQVLVNATSLPIRVKTRPEQISDDILEIFWSGISSGGQRPALKKRRGKNERKS